MTYRPIPHKLRYLGGVNTKPHVVYVYRGADGTVLYVGATSAANYSERIGAHRRTSMWHPFAASVEVESEHPDRAHGRLREAELIDALRPRFNRNRGDIARWRAYIARDQAAS